MPLVQTTCQVLGQLAEVIRQVSPTDFVRPSNTLNQSTIGQHLRHTLEFFLCLEKGLTAQLVNYDQRSHDEGIQSSKELALTVMDRITESLKQHRANIRLTVEVCYDRSGKTWTAVESNYYRELVYNIEHAIHHMALMKIGLREVAPYVVIPGDFGVAVSTLRHQDTTLVAH